MPETSIIVRAFNEDKHLPALFKAIAAQSYRDLEVIFVDSGSYDRSREIASENGARVIRINSHDFTFGYSLNVGIEAAEGSLIAIVSAHTIPEGKDWIERLIEPLRQEGVAMTYGRQIGVPESKFSEAEDFERFFGPHPREDALRRVRANNANSAIRRECWEEKKFNPRITGLEDADWARHWLGRGKRVIYVPGACIRHIHEKPGRRCVEGISGKRSPRGRWACSAADTFRVKSPAICDGWGSICFVRSGRVETPLPHA